MSTGRHVGAAAVAFAVLRWLPRSSAAPGIAIALALLLSYVVLGAVGAYLSKRAGGGPRTRFPAGVFPLALHLLVVVPAIVVSNVTEVREHPDHLRVNLQPGVLFALVLLPGIALAIGTVPFVRGRVERAHPLV